jgi:hypothetical protein
MEWEVLRIQAGRSRDIEKQLEDAGKLGWEPLSVNYVGDMNKNWIAFAKRIKPTPEATPEVTPEVQYITPTAEHVGQMVEVRDDYKAAWEQNKLLAIRDEKSRFRFVCENTGNEAVCYAWKYARVAVKR